MTQSCRLVVALSVIAFCASCDLTVWIGQGGQFAAWAFALNAFLLLAVVNAHTLEENPHV